MLVREYLSSTCLVPGVYRQLQTLTFLKRCQFAALYRLPSEHFALNQRIHIRPKARFLPVAILLSEDPESVGKLYVYRSHAGSFVSLRIRLMLVACTQKTPSK